MKYLDQIKWNIKWKNRQFLQLRDSARLPWDTSNAPPLSPTTRSTAQIPRKYMGKKSEICYLYYHRSFSNLLYCKDKILSYKVKFLNHPSLTIRMFASLSVTATVCKFSDNRSRNEKECKARFRWFLRLDGVELPENIKKMDLNI